jgi:hypothetical protein
VSEAPKMNYYTAAWPLVIEMCPVDVHFTEYLEERGIRDKTIFHFGTGSHHWVGMRCFETGSNNAVLGITASIEEAEAYTRLAIEHPQLSRSYKTLFGDIYLLDRRLLPDFDLVTLFHLCEFWGPESRAYGAMTDREMLDLMTDKTRQGGLILFYVKSMAFDRAQPVIAQWAEERPVEQLEEYKTLLIYRKR